jgi:hypothetical protein
MQKVILLKDDTAILDGKICPFRNPLVLPSQTLAGQLTIENIPCTSACALFRLHKNEQQQEVTLMCGFGTKYNVIIEQEQQTKNNNLSLI